jgi:hypothetical protein
MVPLITSTNPINRKQKNIAKNTIMITRSSNVSLYAV